VEVVEMYSALMLSDLVEARYAARLAEAERRRQLRQLTQQRAHRLGRTLHLPRLRRTTACVPAR
jgi:hypothetical protein